MLISVNKYAYYNSYCQQQILYIHRIYYTIMMDILPRKLVSDTVVPYMIRSQIKISMAKVVTYYQLLQMYDEKMITTIQPLSPSLLNQSVFLFEVDMTPENLRWKIWRNKDQIISFLMRIQVQIQEMMKSKDRAVSNGKKIADLHRQLKGSFEFNQNAMSTFITFVNLLAENIYTRKTEEFLLFIQHCVPVDKWDMKVYQQLEVDKAPGVGNKIAGFFKKGSSQGTRDRDYYLTITSDGILKSDNHLLQSRIKQMIPFTSQLQTKMQTTPDSFITFTCQACTHESLFINFYKDYVKAINFTVGLTMAMQQSSYTQANHRFDSYSPMRENCASKLYVDGAEYYQDLYQELMNAKWQVCITGWMISPYFLLKRPNKIDKKQYRLDGVLEQLAIRGVKIYIICFMEPSMFVNNDSEHVQIYLESLHDNIRVYRHPNISIPILWSHHQKMVIVDQEIGFMGGLDICYGRWDYGQHLLEDPGDLWDGADYNNYRTRDITQPRIYKQSNLNASFEPRMPWHDIALQYRGDIVIDLLRHFVQYWYFVKSELNLDAGKGMNIIKKRYDLAFNTASKAEKEQLSYYMSEIKKKQNPSFGKKLKTMLLGKDERYPELLIQKRPGAKVGNERLQMCRSASQWSIGIRTGHHEHSIHNAYQLLIKESKAYIYIQNQFFMGLQNKIVQCLAERIAKAYNQKKPFKVVIVMPLLPGFEGDIGDPNATVLRIQVHHQYQAIKRSVAKTSLFGRLEYIPNLDDYVFFFGLRQSGLVGKTPTTEIIYVHSKLMITDDERCIIGSANINDRSLLGNRDSQLACIIQEKDGNIFNLRARIFNQHFGISKEETKNIMYQNVWHKIIQNARNATLYYRQVFGCIPDDTVTVAAQIQKLSQKANLSKYQRGRGNLQGHAVVFPLDFMKDEDLTFKLGQKEYFVPEMSFT